MPARKIPQKKKTEAARNLSSSTSNLYYEPSKFFHTKQSEVFNRLLRYYDANITNDKILALNLLINAYDYSERFKSCNGHVAISQRFIIETLCKVEFDPDNRNQNAFTKAINAAYREMGYRGDGIIQYKPADREAKLANRYKLIHAALERLLEEEYERIFKSNIDINILQVAAKLDNLARGPNTTGNLTANEQKDIQLRKVFKNISIATYRIDITALRYFEERTDYFKYKSAESRQSTYSHLLNINLFSNKPQFHNKFCIQTSGRIHNEGCGSLISLPKAIRHNLIFPVDRAKILVEIDLSAAHLRGMYKEFKLPLQLRKQLDAQGNRI